VTTPKGTASGKIETPFEIYTGFEILFKRWGARHWWPGDSQLEIVAGALLAQATNWQNARKAVSNLKEAGLLADTVDSFRKMCRIRKEKLEILLRPSGYYRQKAKRLKALMDFLGKELGSPPWEIPVADTKAWRNKLLGLNGLGPETVDSILLYGFNLPCFVIDAYTRRILARHGMCEEKTSYDELQEIFTKNLPERSELYNEYHALIVRLGKEYCRSNPSCDGCPLARGS